MFDFRLLVLFTEAAEVRPHPLLVFGEGLLLVLFAQVLTRSGRPGSPQSLVNNSQGSKVETYPENPRILRFSEDSAENHFQS